MNRKISFAETLKMYEVYIAGATMEAVGERFNRSRNGVHRAFARWKLPVRHCGGPIPAKSPRRERAIAPRSIVFNPPPRHVLWCGQCDRRVSAAEADQCASRFCKVVGGHQAIGLAIAGHEADLARNRRENHG